MRVLVVTETDACCGPMAAAFMNDFSLHIEVVSAGRHPSQRIEPLLIEAMKECLIDLEGHQPRSIATVNESDFDAVYECPDLPCPATLEECRTLRDFVKNEAYLFFRGLRLWP